MFQASDEFRSLYFIVQMRGIPFARLGRGLRNFLAASSITMESLTMESLPLKVLDFGLQMPTGPSSGVVAFILLVSSRLDCPGISSAEFREEQVNTFYTILPQITL